MKPTLKQTKYATDIASMLHILLPKEASFAAYDQFIRSHKRAFYDRKQEYMANHIRYALPEVEPRLYVNKLGNVYSDLPLTNTENLRRFLYPLMRTLTVETIMIISLDDHGTPLSITKAAMGEKAVESVTQSMIWKVAVLQCAKSIILIQNHAGIYDKPNLNDAEEPTPEEAGLYQQTIAAGQTLGIPVASIILVGPAGTSCFTAEDFLQPTGNASPKQRIRKATPQKAAPKSSTKKIKTHEQK